MKYRLANAALFAGAFLGFLSGIMIGFTLGLAQ